MYFRGDRLLACYSGIDIGNQAKIIESRFSLNQLKESVTSDLIFKEIEQWQIQT